MGNRYCGKQVLWETGTVGNRYCGKQVLWETGTVGNRYCGKQVLWETGTVGNRYCGKQVLWETGTVGNRYCGKQVLWETGTVQETGTVGNRYCRNNRAHFRSVCRLLGESPINGSGARSDALSPYERTKYRTCRMSCDRKYMFAASLQPTDAQDDSNV